MARGTRKHLFLIHGKDSTLSRDAEGFLQSLGVTPIRLAENSEQTVVDRFEHYASNAYAVILLSATQGSQIPSANHLFQLGFFVGKLGRRYVTAIHRDRLELPSELQGVLCVPYDEIGIWKFALVRDLVAAGFAVESKLAVYRPKRPEQYATVRTLVRSSGEG
ncbi:MAG: TIR domain-containing protein [Acidobacteriota bacterium]